MGGVKGKRILAESRQIKEACDELRHWVEHFNRVPGIALRGGVYRQLDPGQIYTTKIQDVEIGYKLEEVAPLLVELDTLPTMKRTVFVKFLGGPLNRLDEQSREAILTAVFGAFVDEQQEIPDLDVIAPDCLRMTQKFKVAVLYEKNPNLVTIAGGYGK